MFYFDNDSDRYCKILFISIKNQYITHHYSITIGVDSISSSSQGSQGLLQSVPSLQVSVAVLYYSIVMVSIGSLSTGFPSLGTFSSSECNNSILQYCYGFNRLQLWHLAQGLLQSVLSLQVSVAMLYHSIVMVSIGSLSTGSPSLCTFF